MTFSEEAWKRTESVYDAIVAHPFNVELADGSLALDRFRHYVLQDSLYLVAFSRSLSIAAARSEATEDMVRFAEAAREAVVVERALHESYFRAFEISAEQARAVEPTPTCLAYTSFLVSAAYHGTVEVAVAALLPCFWIYMEVGNHILARAADDNPYRAWIDTYADEAYAGSVRAVIETADRLAGGVTTATSRAMFEAFQRAAQFEWMFWDAAYRKERWPVGPRSDQI